MFNKSSSVLFLLFAIIFTLTSAAINPTITTPNSCTKWRAGGNFIVKWDNTYHNGTDVLPIPEQLTGVITLGYLEDNEPDNEHLTWTLASGFKLNAGAQNITLPSDLPTKTSYIIVLFGSSDNLSAPFTIRASKN